MKLVRLSLLAVVLSILAFIALTTQGLDAASAPAPESGAARIQENGMRPAEPAVTEKMLSVGPVSLFFRVYRGGAPTILLESGGGDDSGEWTGFAPALAKATGATVITYDRAGFGKSDLPETPYDLAQETEWLFVALKQLGLDKDLVLAGHSYGGLLIRHEAATHPGAVRGLVFIDPFTVNLVDILGIDFCNNAQGLGKLPKLSPEEYAQKDKKTKADLRMGGHPGGSNLAAKCDLIRPLTVPRDVPIRVLTSGLDWLPEILRKPWRQAHEQFAASMPGAKLIVAAESDHVIPKRQPDVVIKALADVIAEGKAGK